MNIFDIPTPTVHLQPNPHREHNFEGRSQLIEITPGSGYQRSLTRVEESLLTSYAVEESIPSNVHVVDNPRYAIKRIMVGDEVLAFQVYDILPNRAHTINVDLTAALNSQHSQYAQMILMKILPYSIV